MGNFMNNRDQRRGESRDDRNRDEEYQGQFGSPWQNRGIERGRFQGRGGYEGERDYEDRNVRFDEGRGIGGRLDESQYGRQFDGRDIDEGPFGRPNFGRGFPQSFDQGTRQQNLGGQRIGQQWGQGAGQWADESFGRGIDLTGNFSNVPRHLLQQIGPHVGKGPQGYKRSDERIREDVCDRLTEHPLIDAATIEVRVQSGEVTLTGTVQDRQMKLLIEQITDTIAGVQDVMNNVKVQRQMASTGLGSITPDRPSQGQYRDQRATS
jgi:hypothetical protein